MERTKKVNKRSKKRMSDEISNVEEEEFKRQASLEEVKLRAETGEKEEEKQSFKQGAKGEEEKFGNEINLAENMGCDNSYRRAGDILKSEKKKKKQKLLKEAAKAVKRGVCYLSRIPPNMDHVMLRQILSQYDEIHRIYLAPEDPNAQVRQKKPGRFRGRGFSEGWVEFANKNVAKRVSNLLNGEQIGGRKRSQFYFDLWNIKYLSKFKWDDLTGEIAYKNAVNKQKLALEFSAAKRERDMYLDKVDQSRALSSIEERIKKKQKVQQESNAQLSNSNQAPKIIRQFPQTKPVADKAKQSKPKLSKEILAGVFGSS